MLWKRFDRSLLRCCMIVDEGIHSTKWLWENVREERIRRGEGK